VTSSNFTSVRARFAFAISSMSLKSVSIFFYQRFLEGDFIPKSIVVIFRGQKEANLVEFFQVTCDLLGHQ
jgi:hypothetical protein